MLKKIKCTGAGNVFSVAVTGGPLSSGVGTQVVLRTKDRGPTLYLFTNELGLSLQSLLKPKSISL